jgi:hypothetical protein
VLNRKTVSAHYGEKLQLPFRGFMRCADCRRVYTPYRKKGGVYFGARCAKDCPNDLKNFGVAHVDDTVQAFLGELQFKPRELRELEARIETDKSTLDQMRREAEASSERVKARIRQDLAYLQDNRLTLLKTGVYSPEELVAEQTSLQAKLANGGGQGAITAKEYEEAIRNVFSVSELLNSLISQYEDANPEEKDTICRTVFSELCLSENTASYKAQNGFRCFLHKEYALGDPIAWISELREQ